ncbi:hypothetical protein [Gemmatimonas sp.]|uniref:hypothetical protein n=1 Tax=Gemmatimonas sp. TaxID=1962908 RepID=UPI00286DC4B6|nr:hypothetical protein [Gemmatimonas sp.]
MRALSRSALLLVALTVPAVARAQGVTVQSVADVRLSGALGVAANIAAKLGGGSMHDIATTTYVSGHRLRTESAASASIIDADAGRITTIDHKQKSYTSMTFAEMSAAMKEAAQSAKESSSKEKAKGKAKDSPSDDSVTFKYKVAVDRPGQREKVSGYDAERVFITVTVEAQVASEGKQDQSVGNLVFLLDQWISKDAPQIAALREFQRAYAQKMGQEFRAQVQGLQSVFANDPRMKNGFEAAAKELAKVPGIALKSATYVSLLPVDMEYDRSLTLGDGATAAKESAAKKDEKPSGGGFRGMMGAMKAAAENAAKQSDKQKSAPPKQSLLMTVTDEVKSITRGAVSAEMFSPPADYKEVKRQ